MIRGGTQEEQTMRCFMCLENIPCSDGDTGKIKEHITKVHCAECNVEKLTLLKCVERQRRERRGEGGMES